MVSIVKKNQSDVAHCSGTLVTSKHIITQALCFRLNPKEDFEVILGSDNLSDSDGWIAEYVEKFNIHKVHQHPSYNERHKFDVAIIELEDEVTFSRGIFPICLPERSTPTNNREGSLVSFAGFGVTEYVNIVCNVS